MCRLNKTITLIATINPDHTLDMKAVPLTMFIPKKRSFGIYATGNQMKAEPFPIRRKEAISLK
jgi:hypothetical protein